MAVEFDGVIGMRVVRAIAFDDFAPGNRAQNIKLDRILDMLLE